jgi:hypothetical protein
MLTLVRPEVRSSVSEGRFPSCATTEIRADIKSDELGSFVVLVLVRRYDWRGSKSQEI